MKTLDEQIDDRCREFSWFGLILFGGGGAALTLYMLQLALRGLVQWTYDTPKFVALLALGLGALWIGVRTVTGRKKAEDEVRQFFARPAGEIVWIHVQQSRRGTTLMVYAVDRAVEQLRLGGAAGRLISDAEADSIVAAAARRWPHATIGYDEQHAALFAADPRRLYRAS